MAVRPGYKQTEVGVIPEDWQIIKLGERATFKTGPFGTALHKSDYTNDGIPVINPMHIIDGYLVPTKSMTLTEEAAKNLSDFRLRQRDIVIGRRGDMGRCAVIQEYQTGWLCGSGSMIIRCTEALVPEFLQRVISSPRAVSAIEDASVGSTMTNLNQSVLANLKIQCPPTKAEQQAIAEALSEVDGLISALDALIAKKRAIKGGAMQELLTGQRRLPGFTGDWEVKKFPVVCWFQEGPGVRNTQFTRFGVKLLNGTNIFRGELFLESTDRFISELEAYGPYSHFLVDVGDIVIACSGVTIDKFDEKVSFIKKEHLPLCMNTSTMRFKPFVEKLIPEYLYHFLMGNSFKDQIGSQATGSAQLNFGPSHVKNVDIALPSLPEQTAIAQILADMDAELAALGQKREKTVALKQGMMQTLLTGQVRLG